MTILDRVREGVYSTEGASFSHSVAQMIRILISFLGF